MPADSAVSKALLGLFISTALLYALTPLASTALGPLLKVLPVALLIIWVLAHWQAKPVWIYLALGFSAVGDVFLALPADGFVFGLGSFLLAQLCYARLFLTRSWLRSSGAILATFAVIMALLVLLWLWPYLDNMAPAVVLYMMAIVAMAATAAFYRHRRGWLFTGAAVFMLSDSLIAVDRFINPLPFAHGSIMLTYYLAQALIVTALYPPLARPSEANLFRQPDER